jgi:hypothetical protein
MKIIGFLLLLILFVVVWQSGPELADTAVSGLSANPDPYEQLLESRKVDRNSTAVWFILAGLVLFALAVGFVVISEKGTKLLRAIKSTRRKPQPRRRNATLYPEIQQVQRVPRPRPKQEVPRWTED